MRKGPIGFAHPRHRWERRRDPERMGHWEQFYQMDGVVAYGPAQPGFKEYLATMADWYQKA